MTTTKLIDNAVAAAKAADISSLRRHLGELRDLINAGRPLQEADAARLVEALCDTTALDAVAARDPAMVIAEVAKNAREAHKRQDAVPAIRKAWPTLLQMLGNTSNQLEPRQVNELLGSLRRARTFDYMALASDRCLGREMEGDGAVRRHYAQGLIDSGQIFAAIALLKPMLDDDKVSKQEKDEAKGLLGRAFKQIYVTYVPSQSTPLEQKRNYARYLESSLQYYASAWDPKAVETCYWHGINVVALLRLAEQDGHAVPAGLDKVDIARKIIDTLEARSPTAGEAWIPVTVAEAHLALGNHDKAAQHFQYFLDHRDVDAFQLAGTVRQLEEVWRLRAGADAAGQMLAVLKAILAGKDGTRIVLRPSEQANLKKIGKEELHRTFETMVKNGKFTQLAILQRIVNCAQAVARIRTPAMHAHGTGFVVDGRELCDTLPPGKYLLTNAHVISTLPQENEQGALKPQDAKILFEAEAFAGTVKFYSCDPVPVWQSPSNEHDATLLRLGADAQHLPVAPLAKPDRKIVAGPNDNPPEGVTRITVLGHPEDEPLSISTLGSVSGDHGVVVDYGAPAADAADPIYMHYVTPTKGGNSGSPVFDVEHWQVVALHHAGFHPENGRPRLKGAVGANFANEGICIQSIRRAIRAAKKSGKQR